MKVKLIVSYDGTAYCGWQKQNNGVSVQQVLEGLFSEKLKEEIKITGSGRTDAGVHAQGQVVSFSTETTLPAEKFPQAFNCFLPQDIKILKGEQVEDDFDARRTAKRKTYEYTLYFGKTEQPLLDRYATYVDKKLDVEKMKKASKVFIGEHDFKCFNASGSEVLTTIRTIYDITFSEEEAQNAEMLKISVTGNGFLYNMVRSVVGTLVKVGLNKMTVNEVKQMLDGGERGMVGKTFPAKGLTLKKVEY